MPGKQNKNLGLIYVLKTLEEYSDEDNFISCNSIAAKIEENYNFSIERKAVLRSINALNDAGFAITKHSKGFSYIDRPFTQSQIQYLIDAVIASKNITAKDSETLISTLQSFVSYKNRKSFDSIHRFDDMNKTDSRVLFLNIELINEAINSNKKISFDFQKYNTEKKLEITSSHPDVSPYKMIMQNQRYYLMCHDGLYGEMSFQKIDRMTNMKILDKPIKPMSSIPGYENGIIDYSKFTTAMPYMFSDKPEPVEMKVRKSAIDYVIEWFGRADITVETLPDNSEYVRVYLKCSLLAMEFWALQFGKNVIIEKPDTLVDRIKSDIKLMEENYGV